MTPASWLSRWWHNGGLFAKCHHAHNRTIGRAVPLLLVRAIMGAVIPGVSCDPTGRPPEECHRIWSLFTPEYSRRGAGGKTDASIILDSPSEVGGVVRKLRWIGDLGPDRDKRTKSFLGEVKGPRPVGAFCLQFWRPPHRTGKRWSQYGRGSQLI